MLWMCTAFVIVQRELVGIFFKSVRLDESDSLRNNGY